MDRPQMSCTLSARVFCEESMEVKRTDYSLLAKMGFLSEVFRQDVREATRTICENAHQLKQV
jgi:hypothetical protein